MELPAEPAAAAPSSSRIAVRVVAMGAKGTDGIRGENGGSPAVLAVAVFCGLGYDKPAADTREIPGKHIEDDGLASAGTHSLIVRGGSRCRSDPGLRADRPGSGQCEAERQDPTAERDSNGLPHIDLLAFQG